MTGAAPHHHDKIVDIVIWLEREAMAVASVSPNSEKAVRLREAAAEIRSMRADKVASRFGQRLPPLRAKGPRT